MHWFLDPILHHYADFNGRTPRKAYWMFTLLNVVFFFGFAMLMGAMSGMLPGSDLGTFFIMIGLLMLIGLALLVPIIAIHVRRLHDLGYSGWWYLISFIPYLGGFALLILMCLPSQEGSNKYGPHPYATAEPLPPAPIPVPVPPPSEQPTA